MSPLENTYLILKICIFKKKNTPLIQEIIWKNFSYITSLAHICNFQGLDFFKLKYRVLRIDQIKLR